MISFIHQRPPLALRKRDLYSKEYLRLGLRLQEVDLQEALEVQVGNLLAVLRAQELAELGVGDDTALEAGVKARVGLDVRRNVLGDIRLALLALGGQAHERGQLIGDRAELEEGVVGTAGLPRGLLLRRHIRRVLAHTALGVADIALQGLQGLTGLSDQRADTRRPLSAERLEVLLELREDHRGGAGLGGRLNSWRYGGGTNNGYSDLGLRSSLARGLGLGGIGGGRGSGGGGLLCSGHRV